MPQPWERRRVVYRRPIGAAPARRPDEQPEDYVRRRDEDVRRQVDADRDATERARREAYERGVREGRRSKKGHPFLTLIVVALAALGLVFIGLWIRSGDPSQAGRQIGTAADVAGQEAREAATVAGQEAREAAGAAGERVNQEYDARTDGDPNTPPPSTSTTPPPVTPAEAGATSTTSTTTTTRQ